MEKSKTSKLVVDLPVGLREALEREAVARNCLTLSEYVRLRLFESVKDAERGANG